MLYPGQVRKRAQLCMTGILSAFQGSPALSPASEAIVSSFEQSLKSVIGPTASGKITEKSVPGKTGAVEVLHMLGGMTGMLPLMSSKTVGRVLPVLGNLVELKQPLLTRRILDTLQALCMSPSAEIPSDVLGDVLGDLASFFSNTKKKDVDEVPVATRVIQHGFERLYQLDPASCARKLPAVFNSLTGLSLDFVYVSDSLPAFLFKLFWIGFFSNSAHAAFKGVSAFHGSIRFNRTPLLNLNNIESTCV